MTSVADDPLLTITRAAKLLDIGRSTLVRWIDIGFVPAENINPDPGQRKPMIRVRRSIVDDLPRRLTGVGSEASQPVRFLELTGGQQDAVG